ncbi:MAG: glycosyltransferase family 4 protein [Pseudomonadota bacterium]
MKIGYLMNTYPVTSGTFIRREIQALEALGLHVQRYAIRHWDHDLVDPADRDEQARTRYLLSSQAAGLFTAFFTELLRDPLGVLRGLGPWLRLIRNAGGGVIRHSAYLLEAVTLKRHAQADGIAHIHTHFSTNSAAVAMLCHLMGGPSYSFTAHGPDEFVDPGSSSLALKIQHATFVVAISYFARRTLIQAGGMEAWHKVEIVRCGLDLSDFPVSEAPFGSNIVCVGRLCPQKGQVLIPAAVESVLMDHPELTVTLIGDGESRADIEAEIAKRGLSSRINLLGWQSNAEVRHHLSTARAMLLPSFAEGLPIVIMEALALGRPVITTYIAGIPELVDGGCGWIVPASSEPDLARALAEAMAADPETLSKLGREGRTRIERHHDLHANALRLKELFTHAAD